MKKMMYMTLHYPCIFLLALQDYWWLYKDNITQLCGRLVRDIEIFIRKTFKFMIYLTVSAPVVWAFMILTIKLS